MKKKLISIILIILLALLPLYVSAEEPAAPGGTNTETTPGGSVEGGEQESTQPEQKGIKVAVSKTEFYSDAEALVTVSIEANSGLKNFMFQIDYDKDNLEYTGFTLDKSVFTGATVLKEDPIQIAGVTTSDTGATGIVITLKFKAKEMAVVKTAYKVEVNTTASYIYDLTDTKADFENEAGYAMVVCKTHTYGEPERLEATCTEAGYEKKTCTVCGEVNETVIVAKGHLVTIWRELSASTCALQGEKEGTCISCNTLVTEQLPLNDHDFSEWIEYIAPTLESLGESRRTCFFCGYEEIQNIPKLVTGITDAESGVTMMGNDGLTFYGDSVFSAKQSLFKDLDENEKNKIKGLVESLVGKEPYSKYSVKFTDINGIPIVLEGTVTVSIPVDASLEGVVVVGVANSNITVLNATVSNSLATFTLGSMPEEFYILCDQKEESIVKTFQNIFADENGEVSTAGKIAGWVIIILIALILLGISATLIMLGVHQQKKKERLAAAAAQTETEFKMQTQTIPVSAVNETVQAEEQPETPEADEDQDYDETVRQMVQDWFDGDEM